MQRRRKARESLSRTLVVDRILRIEFWNGIALLGFVAVVWFCVWAGVISRRYPLMLMTGIWLAVAIAALLWSKWRMAKNASEKERCERLLSNFQEATRLEPN